MSRWSLPGRPRLTLTFKPSAATLKIASGRSRWKRGIGPGSRLTFKSGDNHARVRISTKSGDVRMCAKGA